MYKGMIHGTILIGFSARAGTTAFPWLLHMCCKENCDSLAVRSTSKKACAGHWGRCKRECVLRLVRAAVSSTGAWKGEGEQGEVIMVGEGGVDQMLEGGGSTAG